VTPHVLAEPTGAGDAYRAGLMRGMQLGAPWPVAGRMGALAAAYVLEQFGPQNHTFTRAEFVARYRENFDDEGALDALLRDDEGSLDRPSTPTTSIQMPVPAVS
jgi:adenosine kinase